MNFQFANPYFLLLLVLVLVAARTQLRQPGATVRYSSLRLVKPVVLRNSFRDRRWLVLVRVITLTLFVVALSRPQSGHKLTEISSEGVDIVLAIDTSRSMEALDFTLNGQPAQRLDVVKKVVREFVVQQEANRLGLVVFGSEAYTQCPLTLDYGVVASFVERLKTGMAGDATAIGSALAIATTRLKDLPGKSKVVVLLTDGASNAGPVGPLEAAKAAASFGVKVYTVGIGTNGLAPMARKTLLGVFYDSVQVEFDEHTLTEIARITSGQYFKASDTDALEKIYATIASLEKTEVKIKEHMDWNELYGPFVLLGLALLLVEIVVANTWLRKLP